MASFLSHLSPVPTFPAYTGPYKVGTQDVEIPIPELSSPSLAPDPSISTVSFRISYPCEPGRHAKPVYWLPSPQTQVFRAYARFMSASPRLAAFLSYLPILRTIFYTTIPALRDAKLAIPPEGQEKWPVMVFSHGLGGSRNAYSHITGSLASHGMVVVAAEHRDGSAPISFIHSTDRSSPKPVDYVSVPHRSSPEVEEQRIDQLKIRLWELGLIHDALLKMADGKSLTNVAADAPRDDADRHGFASLIDVHTPGKISWSGHSFGAATVVQFVKSVYYPTPRDSRGYEALYSPSSDSQVSKQITSLSPVALLDLWALPLHFPKTSWLLEKPMPAYQSANGSPPLAVLSEAFFKWTSNLRNIKHVLSPQSKQRTKLAPLIFYPTSSAHLSQSDFGPLFPWLTKKVFKAENPERTLRLNVRAILENLRRSGIKVADTSDVDMELGELSISGAKGIEEKQKFPLGQDHQILAADGSVKGWVSVPLSGRNGIANANGHAIEAENPNEAVMEGEVMKE